MIIAIWIVVEALLTLSLGVLNFYFSLTLFERTQSSSLMALSIVLGIAPNIYLSFIAGKIADTFGRIKIIQLSYVIFTLMNFLLIFFVGGDSTVVVILSFITISSVVGSFNGMSMMALITEVFKEQHLRIALAFRSFINRGVGLLSPVIAALLYGVVAINSIAIATTVMCVIAFICTFKLQSVVNKDLAAKVVPRGQINIKSSFDFVRNNIYLRSSLLFYTIFNATTGISAAFLTAFALMRFGSGKETLSTLNFIIALCAFGGTFLSIKNFKIPPLMLIAITSILCAVFGRICVSYSEILWLFALFVGIRHMLIPIGNMANQMLWVQETPKEKRASLLGFRRLIAQGFYPISVLLVAYLVKILSLNHSLVFLQNLFLYTGILELIICLYLMLQHKRLSSAQ